MPCVCVRVCVCVCVCVSCRLSVSTPSRRSSQPSRSKSAQPKPTTLHTQHPHTHTHTTASASQHTWAPHLSTGGASRASVPRSTRVSEPMVSLGTDVTRAPRSVSVNRVLRSSLDKIGRALEDAMAAVATRAASPPSRHHVVGVSQGGLAGFLQPSQGSRARSSQEVYRTARSTEGAAAQHGLLRGSVGQGQGVFEFLSGWRDEQHMADTLSKQHSAWVQEFKEQVRYADTHTHAHRYTHMYAHTDNYGMSAVSLSSASMYELQACAYCSCKAPSMTSCMCGCVCGCACR